MNFHIPVAVGVALASGMLFPPPVRPQSGSAIAERLTAGHRGQIDMAGGYASTRLVVKFSSGLAGGASEPQVAQAAVPPLFQQWRTSLLSETQGIVHGAAAPGPPPGASDGLRAAWERWRVTAARPLYHHILSSAGSAGGKPLCGRDGLDRTYVIEVPPGTDTALMVKALAELKSDIEAVEVDPIGEVAQVIPSDPDFALQYGLHNTGQTGGLVDADIDAPEAWALHTGEISSAIVTVAIIDTGIDAHPEFGDRMVQGINTVNGMDPNDTSDGCPHGTHVAGIVGAGANNDLGMVGVTWGAKIMPVRVFQFCSGFGSDLAEGIIWAVDNGADVCNISLQFCSSGFAMREAVDYAHDNGVLVVSAAGNNNICGVGVIAFPAALENSMAVAATNRNDFRAGFSNTGPQLDIAAPGDRIWSTWRIDGYGFLNGTSQATPHVSGLAALMKSFAPEFNPLDIGTLLLVTSDDLGDAGWDDKFGYGRINAHRALIAVDPACYPSAAPVADSLGAKNRYLSFSVAGPHRRQAIRVTLVDLPPGFDVFNGEAMWLGPPLEVSELPGVAGDSPPNVTAAPLQCDPFFTDWTALGVVHVFHKNIVPAGVYSIQAVDSGCGVESEGDFSPPLELTASRSGDLVENCHTQPCGPPDGSVDVVTDVLAVLNKFANLPGSPIKVRCDLEPAVPDHIIDIRDVMRVIDAFRGFSYPHLPDDTLCLP